MPWGYKAKPPASGRDPRPGSRIRIELPEPPLRPSSQSPSQQSNSRRPMHQQRAHRGLVRPRSRPARTHRWRSVPDLVQVVVDEFSPGNPPGQSGPSHRPGPGCPGLASGPRARSEHLPVDALAVVRGGPRRGADSTGRHAEPVQDRDWLSTRSLISAELFPRSERMARFMLVVPSTIGAPPATTCTGREPYGFDDALVAPCDSCRGYRPLGRRPSESFEPPHESRSRSGRTACTAVVDGWRARGRLCRPRGTRGIRRRQPGRGPGSSLFPPGPFQPAGEFPTLGCGCGAPRCWALTAAASRRRPTGLPSRPGSARQGRGARRASLTSGLHLGQASSRRPPPPTPPPRH